MRTRLLMRCGLAAAILLALLAPAGVRPAAAAAKDEVSILVLSNRADLISAGNALVEVRVPSGQDASKLRVTLDGLDVTDSFRRRSDGRILGVVKGLRNGPNVLRAVAGRQGARITLTNHPNGGPLLSGPQVQPWVCTTAANGLPPHTDAQCNAPARFQFFYKSATTGEFLPYNRATPPPSGEIATARTDEAKTVPYIVREEVGTQNRGIYAVAVLFDPASTVAPWSPPAAWNRKVMWAFGGGGGPHHLQEPAPSALDDHALSRGFLVATGSLNVQRYTLNNNVQAETLIMLKEHIVETYGEIRRTIGEGCSGGSIQQHLIASMYPGLLDGLIPSCSFPDTWTQGKEIASCLLTQHYFDQVSPQLWANVSQQGAVQGKATTNACRAWNELFSGIFDPSTRGRPDCGLPDDQMYDARTNPKGVRCTIQDYQVAIWGRRAQDGFAKRPLDNVGVQFGLGALRAGTIAPEQFVDLNQKIGSIDIDFAFKPERAEADPGSVAIAYRTNQVTDVRKLADVPILDLRGHSTEELHETFQSYVTRARLDRDNGHHRNQVIWTGAVPIYGDPAFACGLAETGLTFGLGLKAIRDVFHSPPGSAQRCSADPLGVMDDWLDRIEADKSSASRAAKVVAAKPPGLVDMCFIGGQAVKDLQTCERAYPSTQRTPFVVAGEPLTHDVLKCQLRPLNRQDNYGPVPFTDAQWARMVAAFPTGVCDWTKPGVDQQPSIPWMTFAGGPGGRPLGAAPVSSALAAASPGAGASGRGRTLPATGSSDLLLLGAAATLCGALLRRRRLATRR